jgi:hypothetical protein
MCFIEDDNCPTQSGQFSIPFVHPESLLPKSVGMCRPCVRRFVTYFAEWKQNINPAPMKWPFSFFAQICQQTDGPFYLNSFSHQIHSYDTLFLQAPAKSRRIQELWDFRQWNFSGNVAAI